MFPFARQKNVSLCLVKLNSCILFLPADVFDRVFSRIELAAFPGDFTLYGNLSVFEHKLQIVSVFINI